MVVFLMARGLAIAGLLVAVGAGCAPITDLDETRLLRIRAGLLLPAPVVETGDEQSAELFDGLRVIQVLVRFSSVDVATSLGNVGTPGSINTDLLQGGIVLEEEMPADEHIDAVTVQLQQPPTGGGVLAGETVTLFVGGLESASSPGEETPFEFRARTLAPIVMNANDDMLDSDFIICFAAGGWFDEVDLEALEMGVGPVRIDETMNQDAALRIAANIAASVTLRQGQQCNP